MPITQRFMSEKDIYESIDRSIAQADHGELQDAFEALDEITEELEAGYKAMKAVQHQYHNKKVAAY